MNHNENLIFLQDLATVLLVAGVVTVVFHWIRQPVVLGYILAGLIVGPYTTIPVHIHNEQTVRLMSELGVILLMFSLGLHFSLRMLAQVGATAFLAATLEIVVMIGLGYGIGRAFGWKPIDSLFLGAILSISSTTIIVKALGELGLLKEKFAHLVFGILIVEDILAVAMLALLSGLGPTGSLPLGEVFWTLGKLGVFLATVLVFGLLLVPWLLRHVNRLKSEETLLVIALGLCFGVSLLAMKLGYSVALGAFLIGAVVAEARERGKIETLITPVRDLFSAVFFVAIGMLIQPRMLVTYAVPILVITAAVVVGKVVSCALGTFLAGNNARTSLKVGMGLAQIGEFSFIIAQLGLERKVTSEFLYPIAVTVSAITTLLTPYLIRSSDGLAAVASRVAPRPLTNVAGLYGRWVAGLSNVRRGGPVWPLLRKWAVQIALNLALMTGIFVAAAAVARGAESLWPRLPAWVGGPQAVLWLAAMLLSLPLLVVTLRKLRAVALVLAEATVARAGSKENTEAVRGTIALTIRTVVSAGIFLWLLLLSLAVMPPWPIFLVLIAAVLAVAAARWRSFERVYAAAQAALKDTLTEQPAAHADDAPLATLLREAEVASVEVGPASAAGGRLIRELQLRTRTGASAVGIERAGANIVNPGPDEELLPGDRVVLLGRRDQLDAARAVLA